jgi:nucleoside-diphosphate-sugar epimerase
LKILVTGTNGFIGSKLCHVLEENGFSIVAAVRGYIDTEADCATHTVSAGDIGPSTDWSLALNEIDVVIHLAARVHVMKESSKDPLAEYRRVNVEGTRHLSLMAARSGVKRFVYVSTVKVNGENTVEKSFSESDIPSPQNAYAISKWEAEEALRDIASQTGLEIVIIRPPLVYGPGAKGNMLSLMRYIDRGYPLPFGGIHNKRSFISLDNLADVLLTSTTNVNCAGQTFLVSDGDDLSTSELIKRIAAAMNRKSHLINIPEKLFSVIGTMMPPLRPILGRLTGSLVIDSTRFRSVAGWHPPQTVNAGIKDMVSEYLRHKALNAG